MQFIAYSSDLYFSTFCGILLDRHIFLFYVKVTAQGTGGSFVREKPFSEVELACDEGFTLVYVLRWF